MNQAPGNPSRNTFDDMTVSSVEGEPATQEDRSEDSSDSDEAEGADEDGSQILGHAGEDKEDNVASAADDGELCSID